MSEMPNLSDITIEDTREIGRKVKQLEEGDKVKVSSNRLDQYVVGTVTRKRDKLNGEEFYDAIIEDDDGTRYEIHANWRDIMPDSDDQETPYTGLLEEPINDTSPAITYLEVLR